MSIGVCSYCWKRQIPTSCGRRVAFGIYLRTGLLYIRGSAASRLGLSLAAYSHRVSRLGTPSQAICILGEGVQFNMGQCHRVLV